MWRASRHLKAGELLIQNVLSKSGVGEQAWTAVPLIDRVFGKSVFDTAGLTTTSFSRKKNLKTEWDVLKNEGFKVNPCNSKLHPAVEAGIQPDSEEELPVQEAYTPESTCFGCGPSSKDGLGLRSFRYPGGLEARLTLDPKYCAFPGIINGGIISAIFDCHGNWTAAISLMDKGFVPNPPLTLTKELLVTYKEPTPPNEPLVVRSQIVNIQEGVDIGQKATVQVDMALYQSIGGHEKELVTATGLFKRVGALRAL